MASEITLRKSNLCQKNIWNKLSNDLKILNTATSFTHNYETPVLKILVILITIKITRLQF